MRRSPTWVVDTMWPAWEVDVVGLWTVVGPQKLSRRVQDELGLFGSCFQTTFRTRFDGTLLYV